MPRPPKPPKGTSAKPTAGALLTQLLGGTSPGLGNLLGFSDANPQIPLPKPPIHPALLTVKVSLNEAKPPIWRRLEIRGDLTLDVVHAYLQAAMGWSDSHLHRFEPGPARNRYQAPYFVTAFDLEEGDEGTPETDVRLDQLLRVPGDRLFYTYDFGDGWDHTIQLEQIRAATPEDPPARCLKAARACPPEDVGGMFTWNRLAAKLRANPDPQALTGDDEMYANWLPPDIDPDAVDVDDLNLAISFVGLDPQELLAALGGEGSGRALHPAYEAVVERAPTQLVVELAMLASLASEIPLPSEEELQRAVHPWQVLLDVAGEDGIPLTAAGWMAPAACERIWHESGLAWDFGKGNREQNTPEVRFLREEATAARLIRKHKGRLVLTPLGRRAVGDQAALADALAAGLIRGREEFEQDERVLTVLLAATGVTPDAPEEGSMASYSAQWWLLDEVAKLLTAIGWSAEGTPIAHNDLWEAGRVLRVLTIGEGRSTTSRDLPGAGGRYLARRALFPQA